MAEISLVTTPTIVGNSQGEKAVGSVATVQIKRILINALANEFSLRNQVAAKSIIEIGNLATAIYDRTHRNVWGTKYDYNTGAQKQSGRKSFTTLQIEKSLNVKFEVEDYDINKFITEPEDVKGALVSDWISSLTINLLQNLELIFRRGIQDYCLARYEIDKTSVMVFDPSKIKTEDQAKEFFMDYGLIKADKTLMVDSTMVGTSESDWDMAVSAKSFVYFTKAYTALVGGEIAAQTLASGDLYANTIYGQPIRKDFWLNRIFKKRAIGEDIQEAMNTDTTYDLNGTWFISVHNDAIANPAGFSYLRQLINPATGNLMWIGKARVSLPEVLRPGLCFIGRVTEPTSDEIKKAQAKGIVGPTGNEFDLETYTYQVALYDDLAAKVTGGVPSQGAQKLSTLITVLNLGKLADNKNDTIINAIKAKNPNAPSDITLIGVSTTEASVISNSAIGSVKVAFSI